jgi:hypothetical protein
LARISASSAVGASAVAWTTPVNAGRPVAGSSRWWAGAPRASSQLRRPMPVVATPPAAISKACSGAVEWALDHDRPRAGGGPGGVRGGGGPFGGDTSALSTAVAHARAHGGGTVAVSSQQGAAATIIDSGAGVVALGGFSGRESEVSAQWLAEAVKTGKIRWVLTGGDSQGPSDGRTGATSVMSAVAQTCTKVLTTDSGAVLYDCQGHEAALAAITTT